MSEFAIFIDSYDENVDVWSPFFAIFGAYWKNCKHNRYLVNNILDYDCENLKVINTGEERGWFQMTIKGLEAVNEKYILFLLEDYGFSKNINSHDFEEIVEIMEKENIFYYRLTCPDHFSKNKSFIPVPENTSYPISLQPAIWNKGRLLEILNELASEGARTPWDFEKYFIEKYRDGSPDVMIEGIRYDSRNLIGYQNLIIQGKWDPRVIRLYQKAGISIDTNKRDLMTRKAVLLDGIKRNKFVRRLSENNQKRIKTIMKKIGVRFMT